MRRRSRALAARGGLAVAAGGVLLVAGGCAPLAKVRWSHAQLRGLRARTRLAALEPGSPAWMRLRETAEVEWRRAARAAEAMRDPAKVERALAAVGSLLLMAGRHADALPVLEDVLARRETRLGRDHVEVESCLEGLLLCYQATEALDQAEAAARRLLESGRVAHGPGAPQLVARLFALGRTLASRGKLVEALPLFEEAAAALTRLDPPAPAQEVAVQLELAALHRRLGGVPRAEAAAQRALAQLEVPPALPVSLRVRALLEHARVLQARVPPPLEVARSRVAEALALRAELARQPAGSTWQGAAAGARSVAEDLALVPSVAELRLFDATLARDAGDWAAAEASLRQAVAQAERAEAAQQVPWPLSRVLLEARLGLAELLVERGSFDEAGRLAARVEERVVARRGEAHPIVARARAVRGRVALARARVAEARRWAEGVRRSLEAARGDDAIPGHPAWELGIRVAAASGAMDEASTLADELQQAAGEDPAHRERALRVQAAVAFEAGDLAAAARLADVARQALTARLGPRHPDLLEPLLLLAEGFLALPDLAKAEAASARAHELALAHRQPEHPWRAWSERLRGRVEGRREVASVEAAPVSSEAPPPLAPESPAPVPAEAPPPLAPEVPAPAPAPPATPKASALELFQPLR